MRLRDIVEEYPERWVVMAPKQRDERNFVSLWYVLDESKTLSEAKILQKTYENIKHSGVVLYNSKEFENGSIASTVAQFFRVYYGTC